MTFLFNNLTVILMSIFLLDVTISAQDEITQTDTGSTKQEVVMDSSTSEPGDLAVTPEVKKPIIIKMKKADKIALISFSAIFAVVLGLFIYSKAE